MVNKDLSRVTRDDIFETLATDEKRLEGLRRRSHGLWHGGRISPVDPEPGDEVTVTVTVGSDLSVRQMVLRITTDGSIPDASSPSLPMAEASPRWDSLAWGYVEEWVATIPAQDEGTLVHYRIQAITDASVVLWADADPGTGEPGLFAYGVDRDQVPPWLRQAVIYHVDVDRFAPDPGKHLVRPHNPEDNWGGTLKGLIARLDHIADLGATAICLSSVFPFPAHDAGDGTSIATHPGTDADLMALILATHGRGIRVMLDIDMQDDSTARPTSGAVQKDSAEDLIHVASTWLERGVDGYWLSGINGRSQAFWSRFRRALRAVKLDVALIGEVVESAETMASYEGRLDGTLDFLLMQQMRAFFAFDGIDAAGFWRFLSRHLAWMPANLALPSLFDNNTVDGFLAASGGNIRRLKIAALVQCALPHPAVVSYGTEVGLSHRRGLGSPDGSHRIEGSLLPMLWGEQQDRDLRSFYRALIFWRKSQNIHATSPMHVYAGDSGLLCFRTGQWFVVLNRSDEDAAIDFQEHGEVWLALGTEFDVQLHGSAIQLPPMSGAILRG